MLPEILHLATGGADFTDIMKRVIFRLWIDLSRIFPFTVAVIDMDWHLVDIDPKYGSGWTDIRGTGNYSQIQYDFWTIYIQEG